MQLARVTADRWEELERRELVARQEADQQRSAFAVSQATFNAAQANVEAQEANVRQLEALQSSRRVTAPFDGIITARNVEAGALITAGSSSTTPQLLKLARIDTLRIYANVPQSFVASIRPGQTAQVLVQELSQRSFTGQVVRTANVLDPTSRTLLTEVQLSNRDGTLLPGMYAQVKFVDHPCQSTLADPSEQPADSPRWPAGRHRRRRPQGALSKGRRRPGLWDGDQTSGLIGTEALIPNPDDLAEGAPVQVVAGLQ